MKTAIKTTLAVVASAAAIAGVSTIPSIVSAWGDSDGGRQSYSLQYINEHAEEFGSTPFFNSITIADSDYAWHKNHFGENIPAGTVTHEKNYVGARENTGVNAGVNNIWAGNDITVEEGKSYIVRLYVHNNNPNGEKAVSENTRVRFSIPLESAKTAKVNGFITSSNASPKEYVDYVNFNSDRAFHLEYVKGSALFENQGIGKNGGVKLDDSVVNSKDGVLIGYNALDGRVPGCYNYDGYITIEVKPVFDDEFTVEEKVRVVGSEDKEFKYAVNANIGDIVEFQLQYKNTSNNSHKQVVVRDVLPKSLKYIDDTTKLYNADYKNGAVAKQNTITTEEGVNIGNYAAGANAFVRFRAEVVGDTMACGANALVNWGQAQAGVEGSKVMLQDKATVYVTKVCENKPEEPTPTPEPTPELPYTGPEAIAGGVVAAGSIVTAAGYYIASRRQLR